jgi:hypothetical protein
MIEQSCGPECFNIKIEIYLILNLHGWQFTTKHISVETSAKATQKCPHHSSFSGLNFQT